MGSIIELTLGICFFLAAIWFTCVFMWRFTQHVNGGEAITQALKSTWKDLWS